MYLLFCYLIDYEKLNIGKHRFIHPIGIYFNVMNYETPSVNQSCKQLLIIAVLTICLRPILPALK